MHSPAVTMKEGFPFAHYLSLENSEGADWDGLCDNLKAVPQAHIFKLGALLLLSNLVSDSRLELRCVFLNVNIRSNLIYLHGFQLLLAFL